MLALVTLTLALIGSVVAEPIVGRSCGSHPSDEAIAVVEKQFQESELAVAANKSYNIDVRECGFSLDSKTLNSSTFATQVYFHVINTVEGGNIAYNLK
ncbi:hypothetical protein H0H93_002085 [Arthromyces matolae]|nr:hypothetical protein H0H93_002085 [Arthromyces matolae]